MSSIYYRSWSGTVVTETHGNSEIVEVLDGYVLGVRLAASMFKAGELVEAT